MTPPPQQQQGLTKNPIKLKQKKKLFDMVRCVLFGYFSRCTHFSYNVMIKHAIVER